MKQILLSFLFVATFLVAPRAVFAAGDTCNAKCDVNEDCGKGYKCFVGVCRAVACASSTTCSCSVTATPAASATPIAQVVISATPASKATPAASSSAIVKNAPKTGVSTPVLLVSALLMAVVGFKMQSAQV